MKPLFSARGRRGFTLLEMMITLAIFILLSASVFGIVSAVLQSAKSLQSNQTQQDQLMSLKAFIDHQFNDLIAESSVVSYRRGEGEGLTINGIIFGQPDVMNALDAKVQPNGYYTLRLVRYSASERSNPTLSTLASLQNCIAQENVQLAWQPLIMDVQQISWKFRDENLQDWVEVWPSPDRKPSLIELSLQVAGQIQPTVMDFWIPARDANPVVIAIPSTTGGSTNAP